MDTYKKQRKDHRVPVSYVSVELRTITGEVTYNEQCTILDISLSGMRFAAKKILEQGELIRLTFMLPQLKIPIRCEATVIHIEMYEMKYSIGVQFKNIGLAEYSILREFVSKNLQ